LLKDPSGGIHGEGEGRTAKLCMGSFGG